MNAYRTWTAYRTTFTFHVEDLLTAALVYSSGDVLKPEVRIAANIGLHFEMITVGAVL